MIRPLTIAVLAAALLVSSVQVAGAQQPLARLSQGPSANGSRFGGLFARLNRSPVPTRPGLPSASPLGLIAPRLSNMVSVFQFGGFRSQAGRLAVLGVLSPRVSPLVALVRTPPATSRERALYGLTILSPRVVVLLEMLRAARTQATGMVSSLR
jgi:hypothetical protein